MTQMKWLRDFIEKLVKRIDSAFVRNPSYEFNVELLEDDKIAFNECEGVIRGEHEDLSRTIEISKIDAVGYMTYGADPVLCDFPPNHRPTVANVRDGLHCQAIVSPREPRKTFAFSRVLPAYRTQNRLRPIDF